MASVCFVCLGNICRSPTAEGILRHLAEKSGRKLEIDSAGTSAYHQGDAPDRRSVAAARAQGIELTGQSRQFVVADFDRFDHIVAMDGSNLRNLRKLARSPADLARLSLLRQWRVGHDGPDDSVSKGVPDPYYEGNDGFHTVFAICMAGCEGLLESLSPR